MSRCHKEDPLSSVDHALTVDLYHLVVSWSRLNHSYLSIHGVKSMLEGCMIVLPYKRDLDVGKNLTFENPNT